MFLNKYARAMHQEVTYGQGEASYRSPGVFEALASVCRNPQEGLKQFVENAADAVEQVGTDEGQSRLRLRHEPTGNGHRESSLRSITIQDNGVGMTPEKMKQVLHRIGDSEKINLTLRGEQGIGILAFALVAEELHLASSVEEGAIEMVGILAEAESLLW